MADGITIRLDGFDDFRDNLKNFAALLEKELSKLLDKHAANIVTKAKDTAPTNLGTLKGEIFFTRPNSLVRHITVDVPYAAFMEFGTGKFAAEEVAKLPSDWQSYATQFRGLKGPGTFDDFVLIIKQWLIDKGIDVFARNELANNIDIDTGVSGAKKTRHRKGEREAQYDQVAYAIASKIVIEGVRAQPYLYPAYKSELPLIEADLKKLFT